MAEAKKPEKNDAPRTAQLHAQPPIFNLGRLKRRKRRRLKQGRGTAMGEVHQAINMVHSGVAHEGDHHPVIISYEKKRRKKKKTIRVMGLKINRRKYKKRLKKNGIRIPGL